DAAPGGDLYAAFDLSDGSIRVSVSADSMSDAEPDEDSFGWQVLTALTSEVLTNREGLLRWASFTVRSSIAALRRGRPRVCGRATWRWWCHHPRPEPCLVPGARRSLRLR